MVWHRSNSHSTDNTWTSHLVHTSILISNGINPVIYCFRTSRFRCALKQLLNDPCGKTAFQEIKQEQRAIEIIPNRIARGDKIAREPDQDTFKTALEPDQDRFERTSCPSLFQWVSNSNCCTGRMGRVAPRFQQCGIMWPRSSRVSFWVTSEITGNKLMDGEGMQVSCTLYF